MKSTNKAFSMIELIFIIVILGILSAIALPKILGYQSTTPPSTQVPPATSEDW